ncbi:MAG: twin-arginine translocation pathway signal [Xanthobacteraceae bacterium]
MPDRLVMLRGLLPARVLQLVALCALVTGCATSEGPYFFADAGKYQFHSCEQLAAVSKQKHDRQRELKELIDKAEQGAGGQIVSVLAYRSDYVAVNEELQVIDSTVREKNCAAAAPPSKGAPRQASPQ